MEFGGKRLNTCMIEEAFGAPVKGGTYPLDCTASDPEFASLRSTPAQVQPAGDKLYRALIKHEALNDLFKLTKSGTGPYPLYIRVDTPDAEELPWETLWENQFFSLDQNGRWPI